jgi:Fe-S cluster assembly iron-binding protein IscA
MMQKQDVDQLPGGASFLTVTPTAQEVIRNIAATKPRGCFRIEADIRPQQTLWRYEWVDEFTDQDYITEVAGVEIVMTATTIAYILDEYTLDYVNSAFHIKKNAQGPLRHQK